MGTALPIGMLLHEQADVHRYDKARKAGAPPTVTK